MRLSIVNSALEYVLPPYTTPCGRKVSLSGRMAKHLTFIPDRLCEITPIALEILSYLGVIKLNFVCFKQTIHLLPFAPAAILISALIAIQLTYLEIVEKIEIVSKPRIIPEIRRQKNEKELIEALGGQKAFDQLPTTKNDRIKWDNLRPADFNNQPLTVRKGGNFALFLCLREKENLKGNLGEQRPPLALELSSQFYDDRYANKWFLLGPTNPTGIFVEVFAKQGEAPLKEILPDLKQLINNQHPKYELLPISSP